MNDRLMELETRVAFQEDTILKLQESVAEQEQLLYRLSKEMEAIRRHLIESGPSPDDSDEEPPPPHY